MAETTEITTVEGTTTQNVVTSFENAQSSIEIGTNSKGLPVPTVKLYCENDRASVESTATFACRIYQEIRVQLGLGSSIG